MPQITYSADAISDFERISNFMLDVSPSTQPKMMLQILNQIGMLKTHPELGKPSDIASARCENLRQLYIPFGSAGYVVIYEFMKHADLIEIASVKHTRELKFSIEK